MVHHTSSRDLLTAFLALHPKRIDLSLGRMQRLLAALGQPQEKLPPVIHIAGTNGKGSTLAMLRAMLEADDKRVHAYTSPHLMRFHERIYLAGAPIAEAYLVDCLARCEAANAGAPITFFEITTAAAFLAMSEQAADFTLLEVGLGGRLDATNVMRPILTAITPVSLDHMAFLGDTLAQIAAEKAGIIKPEVPVICAPQARRAQAVITAIAETQNAPLAIGQQDWHSTQENGRLVFQDNDGLLDLPLPVLRGPHQLTNAGTAIGLARALNLPQKAMATGLQKTHWPARLQKLSHGKIARDCPNADIWLDGGHNEAAAHALADWLNAGDNARPIHLVLGLMETKTHKNILAAFADVVAPLYVHCIPIEGQKKSAHADDLRASAHECGLHAQAHANLAEALSAIGAAQARILIAGSLYLAGEVLAFNG